jgi:hypothetical protein
MFTENHGKRIKRVFVYNNYDLEKFCMLCSPCISIYACNEANLMHQVVYFQFIPSL